MSLLMGKRVVPRRRATSGAEINFLDGRSRLTNDWLEWWLIRPADEWIGESRKRPGRARMWLERHGLALAVVGIVMFALNFGLLIAWVLLNV